MIKKILDLPAMPILLLLVVANLLGLLANFFIDGRQSAVLEKLVEVHCLDDDHQHEEGNPDYE